MKKIFTLLLLLSGAASMAQTQAPARHLPTAVEMLKEGIAGLGSLYVLTGIVFFFLLLIVLMLLKVNSVLKTYIIQAKLEAGKQLSFEEQEALEESKQSLLEKLLQLKPLATEKDKMMHHSYDGITELNNPTPPWFMMLFYSCVIFGGIYLVIYHVSYSSPLQHEEFENELKIAAAEKEEYMKKAANSINESNVAFVTDKKSLEAGKETFIKYCKSCHMEDGGGQVGPNLTDDYWLHGNKAANLFKVVTDGVPSKGMVSWKKQINPMQIQQVISYIHTLKGTKPANPKEPQGELMQ